MMTLLILPLVSSLDGYCLRYILSNIPAMDISRLNRMMKRKPVFIE